MRGHQRCKACDGSFFDVDRSRSNCRSHGLNSLATIRFLVCSATLKVSLLLTLNVSGMSSPDSFSAPSLQAMPEDEIAKRAQVSSVSVRLLAIVDQFADLDAEITRRFAQSPRSANSFCRIMLGLEISSAVNEDSRHCETRHRHAQNEDGNK